MKCRHLVASGCLLAIIPLCAMASGNKHLKPVSALDESKVGLAAKFVPINAGGFEMGSPADEAGRKDDEVLHTVEVTKDFEMQATDVTQLQYFLVTGRSPSVSKRRKDCDQGNFQVRHGVRLCAHHPVENVSWADARAFIAKINQLQDSYVYRLPSEAEWEYAARGGTLSRFADHKSFCVVYSSSSSSSLKATRLFRSG